MVHDYNNFRETVLYRQEGHSDFAAELTSTDPQDLQVELTRVAQLGEGHAQWVGGINWLDLPGLRACSPEHKAKQQAEAFRHAKTLAVIARAHQVMPEYSIDELVEIMDEAFNFPGRGEEARNNRINELQVEANAAPAFYDRAGHQVSRSAKAQLLMMSLWYGKS